MNTRAFYDGMFRGLFLVWDLPMSGVDRKAYDDLITLAHERGYNAAVRGMRMLIDECSRLGRDMLPADKLAVLRLTREAILGPRDPMAAK